MFTSFDEPTAQPSTQEMIQGMSGVQRSGILNAFAEGISPTQAKVATGLNTLL